MIRPAKHVDTPRILDLLDEMQAASKYAGLVAVDRKSAQALIQQSCIRHGGEHPGGTLFNVCETDGVVEGFMIGMLDRVYHIGDKLAATDVLLYASPRSDPRDMIAMVDAYVGWASGNPKVVEILLSWNDTMPGAQRIAGFYKRKGFAFSGEMYSRMSGEKLGVAA